MLTSGTTCFADMHLFPEVVAQTASAAKIRACIGLPVADTPSPWAGSANECLAKGIALHDEYRGDPLVTTALAPDLDASADETLVRVRRGADELELPVTMPADETRSTLGSLDRTWPRGRSSGSALLGRELRCRCRARHELSTTAEIDATQPVGAGVVHCSRIDLKLGSGVCPAAERSARGVNVALGTDARGLRTTISTCSPELRTAALRRAGCRRQARMPSHETSCAATLDGARALGLGESHGLRSSQASGRTCAASTCASRAQQPSTMPRPLLFSASRDQVSDVWVAGRRVVQDGRAAHID